CCVWRPRSPLWTALGPLRVETSARSYRDRRIHWQCRCAHRATDRVRKHSPSLAFPACGGGKDGGTTNRDRTLRRKECAKLTPDLGRINEFSQLRLISARQECAPRSTRHAPADSAPLGHKGGSLCRASANSIRQPRPRASTKLQPDHAGR